ncbi:hypothetical protein BU25DRAFT_328761, partial [Macroventuria anomochaeta]
QLSCAALSYCRRSKGGAAYPIRTTRDSLDTHVAGIRANRMTCVVRDAVEVCQALSIRYLWADALYIIQKDHQDWTRESERMG